MQNIQNKILYVTYKIYPIYPPKSYTVINNSEKNIAIIIQGPIIDNNNFTYETVLYYINQYPDACIIISTWNDTDRRLIESFNNLDVSIILNEKPKNPGIRNVNYQIYSTVEGIKYAKRNGCKYVVKTRTDQRICKKNAIDFMISQIKNIPADNPRLKARIGVLDINYGNMFTPYFWSDFLYVGDIDDINKVFSIHLDDREYFQMERGASKFDYAERKYPPEIYIMTNFLESIDYKLDYSVKSSWEITKDILICFDSKMIDLFWPKYNTFRELHWFYGDYFENEDEMKLKSCKFDYITWSNLYNGVLKYDEKYEELAKTKWENSI